MIISILILAIFSINGIICQMNQFPNGFMMYSSYPANQYNPNFNRDYNQDQNRFGNQENFNQFNWKQQYQNLSESRQIGTHTMSNQNWNQQDNQKDCTAPRTRGDFCQNEQKLMFYYDLARKVCQPFMYNGCNGNGNRFSSAVECKEYCAGEKGLVQPLKDVPQENTQIMKNTCQGEYDTMHRTVQRCSYSQECSMGHECQGGICCPTRNYLCNLRYDSGKFTQGVEKSDKYFFTSEFNTCMRFSYYGTLGNANNFPDYNSCMRECGTLRG